ncbi:MAG: glycosyltransferase family 4 protein [Lentisphaerae bacterium]|nr:glycosyltransferase family 4 protein [Lentisphaerota bacterium]
MTEKTGRILLISPQPFFQWRGSPLRVRFNVQALAELGHAVDLLVMPVGDDLPIPGVTLHRAPNLLRVKNLAIGPSAAKAVLDIGLFFKAAALARRNRYDVFHGIEDAGPIAAVLARRHRAKMVFEKHSDPASYKKGFLRNLVMAAYRRVERFSILRADAVIGTGPALVEQARRIAPDKPVHHIFDIPSSLIEPDPEQSAAARERLGLPPGAVAALYVGSFAVYQGIDLLFDSLALALARTPFLHAVIIGGSPAEIAGRRAQMAAAGCGDRVVFPGRIPPDELPHTLAAADILLSPRVAGGNTPLKLLDYLKAGRAIVACDNPANRLILDESTARLAAPDPESFAAGIAALAADAALRRRLGTAGRALYLSTYNYARYKQLLGDAYRALLA